MEHSYELDLGLMHVKEPKPLITIYMPMMMNLVLCYHTCLRPIPLCYHTYLRPIPLCYHTYLRPICCHIIPTMLTRFHLRWEYTLGSLGKLEMGYET